MAEVVTSEIADFDEDTRRTIQILRQVGDSQLVEKARLEQQISVGRITRPVTVGTKDGTFSVVEDEDDALVVLSSQEIMAQTLELIQRNLSTGIGQAVDIRCLEHLTPQSAALPPDSKHTFPVPGGKKRFAAAIGDGDTALNFAEEGKPGRGPRGIVFNGRGYVDAWYRFDPNPHSINKYNKKGKQQDLYRAAADAFVAQPVEGGNVAEAQSAEGGNTAEAPTPPQEFDFECYNTTFTATLQ